MQRFIALQRPPFGTSKLNTWMRTAFAPEIAKEKGRLDSFNKVAHPGPGAMPAAPGVAPRVPSLGATSPQNPTARRPPPAAPAGGTEELELPEVEDEMAGEATMITSSPFDMMEEQRARENEELTEEPTQIFFTADDMEELEEVRGGPAAPAGGLRPMPDAGAGKAPPAATFPKPRPVGTPPTVQVSPSIPVAPMPPPQARPPAPQQSPFKSTLALSQEQLPAPPPPQPMPMPMPAGPPPGAQPLDPSGFGGADPFAPPPPAQRNLHTVEVRREPEKKSSGAGKWIALLAVGALLVAGLSVGAAYLLFGGEETGSISIRVTPENADARVFVDGVQRGRAPLLLEHVPAGDHQIEVRAEGYASATRTVPVSGGTSMLEIAITPATIVAAAPPTTVAAPPVAPSPAPTPAPAAVIAPVEPVAPAPAPPPAPTPVAAEEPEPEPAPVVRLVETPRTTPRVAEAEPRPRPTRAEEPAPTRPRPVRVEEEEEPAPRPTPTPRGGGGFGTLTINTVPWARVFIDGRDTGRNTPVRDLRVPAGQHTIGLRTNDGTMHRVQVNVPAGGTERVVRQL